MSKTEENKDKNENKQIIAEYEWSIRPCEMYKDEYSECISIRGRFQQYFIFGQTIDCSQWKRDLDNCWKWKENNDEVAAVKIIESEKTRRKERLRAHYNNDIWEKRETPPADWNKPLPEHILKDYENSYLDLKSKEMKGEITPLTASVTGRTFCSIM